MFRYLLAFILFYNYCLRYEDPFEDIMNQYIYKENITKLLLVKKGANIRSCNELKCDIVRKVPENTLLVSSNFDKFYQVKYNEWISPDLVEEVKIHNQRDFRLKKNLTPYNSYILYKGLIKKGDIIYDIKKEILLEVNQNEIIDNKRNINKFIILKEDKNNSIIKLNFLDLLQINLSSFYTFSDLEKDKDYIITDKSKKSFFIF